MGGFCLLVELDREGSASAACAACLLNPKSWSPYILKYMILTSINADILMSWHIAIKTYEHPEFLLPDFLTSWHSNKLWLWHFNSLIIWQTVTLISWLLDSSWHPCPQVKMLWFAWEMAAFTCAAELGISGKNYWQEPLDISDSLACIHTSLVLAQYVKLGSSSKVFA